MSRRGVLLFINEAEAFLGSRGKRATSESVHNALNAMLYSTGDERKDFMLVLAAERESTIPYSCSATPNQLRRHVDRGRRTAKVCRSSRNTNCNSTARSLERRRAQETS